MEPTGNNDLPNINDLPFEIYYNDHLKDVILIVIILLIKN